MAGEVRRRRRAIRRAPPSHRRTPRLYAVLLALCAAVACNLAGGRVASHLERADELLAEGRGTEALIEMRSAAVLAPDDPSVVLRVAETSEAYGYVGDAVDFYRDYLAQVPGDDERRVALASLLVHDEPDEASRLLAEVFDRNPRHVGAWLANAKLALARDDVRTAMGHIHRAKSIDADDPEVYWTLALAHEARINDLERRTGTRVRSPALHEAAIEAYEEYREKGGERVVPSLLRRAHLMARLKGRDRDARRTFANAVRAAQLSRNEFERRQVYRTASLYARQRGHRTLEIRALRAWLAFEPGQLPAWQQLSQVPTRNQAAWTEKVLAEMLETLPEDPRAHVLYAQHLAEARGLDAGLSHLQARMGSEMDEAVLLAGVIQLQIAAGRPKDARRSFEELSERYPERRLTRLLAAQRALARRRHDEAVRLLQQVIEERADEESLSLLARAELARGRIDEARNAVNRALRMAPSSSWPDLYRLKAQIQIEDGRHRQAAATLRRLAKLEPLDERDQLMLARAYYASGGPGIGQRILLDLLEDGSTRPEIALEFARRHGAVPQLRAEVEKWLNAARRAAPDDLRVLAALTDLDLRHGDANRAMRRLQVALDRQRDRGELYLLRARTSFALGRTKLAREDVERALLLDPKVREPAFELLSQIYLSAPDPALVVEQLQDLDARGRLSNDHLVLLGRMQVESGESEAALATYERALAAGSELVMLKNDLAYLLARSGRDLDRALALAREATEAPVESLAAADTLGYVHLRAERFEAAYWQFRFVTSHADPPVAGYYYHLALALIGLGREDEARDALKTALSIDPEFPESESARLQLSRLTTHPDPATGSS